MPAAAMLMLSAVLAATMPADRPADSNTVHIAIEQEAGVALADADVQAIARDIERIWRPAVRVIAAAGDGPAGVLAREHVRLVLTRRSLPRTDAAGIGWIEFVDDEPQPVLTVSLAAVSRLLATGAWNGRPFASLPARASTIFTRRAVARAAAHELGHYLLRTREHARRGLMRAIYSVDDIMSGNTKHSRLDPKALASLQDEWPDRMAERVLRPDANE